MAERNRNEYLEKMKRSAEKRKLSKRKNQIQMVLMQRRNLFANQNGEQMEQNHKPQEDKEDMILDSREEDPRGIKGLNLSKHYKKRKKSKKRCWICKSPTHFKNRCPYIRCFWCHKTGHIKTNCHMKMIEYVYHRVKEDVARKEMKMEQNQKKREQKMEQKQYEKKILEIRIKELNSKLEEKEGKGEVQVLQWKGKTIGEYKGPGLIRPILEKFRRNLFDFEQINRLLDKATPVKSLNLYRGFSNWCACGTIDLNSRDYIGHCMDHHRGIAMKDSQLNRPPWMDWVDYDNDEVMEQLCFTDENLDKIINNY